MQKDDYLRADSGGIHISAGPDLRGLQIGLLLHGGMV